MLDIALMFFSMTGMLLCLLPLRIHWRARNTGTLLHIFWSCLGCLSVLLNTVIWANNVDDHAPVFCDISVKVQSAYSTGITAASLCITRRLAAIASSRSRALSQKRKRIDLAIDLSLGLGLPLIVMASSYVVQPHRYDIFEAFGCEPSVWTSVPAIFLIYWWPALLSTASTVFGVIAIAHFLARRLQFNTVLRQSQSGLNSSQYIRLISLAGADVVFGLPLNLYFLVRAAQTARPWLGWAKVHEEWSQVLHFTAAVMIRDDEGMVLRMLSKYLCPMLAIIFFLFFGVSEDSLSEYERWGRQIKRVLRLDSPKKVAEESPKNWPTLGSTINHLTTPYNHEQPPASAKSPMSPYHSNSLAINVEIEKQTV